MNSPNKMEGVSRPSSSSSMKSRRKSMKMSIDMEEDMDFQQVSVPHPPDIQEQISTAVGIAVAQALADNQPASSPQLVREPSVTFEDAFGSTEVQEKGELISLMAGDLIWLRTDDAGCKGMVLGDDSLRSVGVEPDEATGTTSPRFPEGVFRLCVGLNYRARTELGKIKKAIRQADNRADVISEFNPELGEKRALLEESQNQEQLDKLARGEGAELIKYGDIIQLQHTRSGLFLSTHKTPAPANPTCRKVSLKKGSLGCHFRILPRFKVRSKGSVVYADDQIQLQSVKFEYLKLGASPKFEEPDRREVVIEPPNSPKTTVRLSAKKAHLPKIQHLRKPFVIQREASCEVNGSMDPYRCFSVKLFYRQRRRGILLSGHYFRMFHPEENAYVQASSDPDKGEVLDATGEGDVKTRVRAHRLPAHIPYLKTFVSSVDASNPIHLSAKAVWCFEPVDRTRCCEVKWDMPLRLRHVPSGKFLSVISIYPAILQEPKEGTFFDAALVFDVDPEAEEGDLGSASSMLFNLVATDVTSANLKTVVSTVRLEHVTHTGRTLHFVAAKEHKPHMGSGRRKSTVNSATGKDAGWRICFSSDLSSLDVLKIQPLSTQDTDILSRVLSRIRIFRRYTYLWQAVGLNEIEPVTLAEAVAGQCLDVIDDIRKGIPPPRRFGGNVSELMKEAVNTQPYAFAALYGGDADQRLQKVAFEVKLLDAVFEAALAPYNHATVIGKGTSPFDNLGEEGELTSAVQKFLYVTIQRIVRNNLLSQDYFARRTSRVWSHPQLAVHSDGISEEDDGNDIVRHSELWRNIIIDQGEDSLGATVTLGQLLRSSESIVNKLVNNELMDRFKNLVAKCGPELRFINLFTAICFVEGKPSRANQEMCVRKLWMNLPDRYAFGVTFHENIDLTGAKNFDKTPLQPSPLRARAPSKSPAAFLGKTEDNLYHPVCIAWSGYFDWAPNCGALWYSPAALKLPVVGTHKAPGVLVPIMYVPIEHVMWVLDPFRLCKAVTGRHWKPFGMQVKKKSSKRALRKSMNPLGQAANYRLKLAQERFSHQLVLASYIVAQLELFTNMCKGRSMNCIRWLEQNFSYGLLMNLATNPLLPSKLTAVAIGFVEALYVDRFPQMPYGGAPCLPEKLWVYEDLHQDEGPRKSAVPVLGTDLSLKSDRAFPAFFLPALCSAHGDPDPVLSHPDHFKFFLLRKYCNEVLIGFGKAGRVIHNEGDFNQYGMAAIQGQNALLQFGFQSTHVKLKEMCVPNGLLLDGRSDLDHMGRVFSPAVSRYHQGGTEYDIVTKLKVSLIDTFNDVADLRSNFRLGKLLHSFKEKAEVWIKSERNHKKKSFNVSSWGTANVMPDSIMTTLPEAQYIMQNSASAIDALYDDFEAMFPGGTDEASQLDLTVLCEKEDMDIALVDAIMYDDDNLMAAALKLLESTYGQRRRLRNALQEVFLLEEPHLPVYGDIHQLRSHLVEIMFLIRTSSVWGVKSRISGPFGDEQFGSILSILDRLHAFVYFDPMEDMDDNDGEIDAANYQGYFKETGLDGVTYESTNLWSLDVAGKWGARLVPGATGGANLIHQNMLRACNFQSVLEESIQMDPEIAWKGSICTDREKEESERRLTLVMRAFLSLASAFSRSNPINQNCLFPKMNSLETLATPTVMKIALNDGNTGLDSRKGSVRLDASVSDSFEHANTVRARGGIAWPYSISDLAQALILTILRGNGSLCEQVGPSLLRLFASIADQSPDPSTSPVLDLLFILSKPEVAPETEFQLIACDQILGRPHRRKVAEAMGNCINSAGATLLKMEDPARLVRLAMAMIEGGNERAASQLKQVSGMTIDSVCTSIINVLIKEGLGNANADSKKVLEFLTKEGELGKALNDLLIELVFLLPLNSDQMTSKPLWNYLEFAMVPCMEAFGRSESMNIVEAEVAGEFIGVVEVLFMTLIRLGIFNKAMTVSEKERIVSEIAEDVETIVNRRQKPPELLETAFLAALDQYGVEALDVVQFVELVESLTDMTDKTLNETDAKAAANTRRRELTDAFIEADLDGDATVDLYEFVKLYNDVTVSHGAVSVSKGDALQKQGNKLSLRTVECCNRIVHIKKGNGPELGVKRFSRGDRYGSRLRKSKAPNNASAQMGTNSSSSNLTASAPPPLSSPGNKKSPMMSAKSRRDFREGDSNLQEKFNAFKRGVDKNPRIIEALQRRKFTMVGILEKGTPGPPEEYGRSLICNKEVPNTAQLSPLHKKKRASAFGGSQVAPESSLVPAKAVKPTNLTAAAARKAKALAKARAEELENWTIDDDKAALIQTAFRCMKARAEIAQKKVVSRLDGGANSNRLSGAIELTWKDISSRFVRFVGDHYWESGGDGEVCVMILDTWLAHLVKARTYFHDASGNKLPHDQIGKAKSLHYKKPHMLNEVELAAYHLKQSNLNELGVTALLARIVSSLSDDITPGGLTDKAIQLFMELLDGGNIEVQTCLYNHLIEVDAEGKMLMHLDARLARGFEVIAEAKSQGIIGTDDEALTEDIVEDCQSLIQTTRTMQLLCEGHHSGFQDYIRHQPMHTSSHVNLVRSVANILILLCDSSFVIGRFTSIEISLVSQLLYFLVECIQGPCAGNQELIAKSDVIASLNNIIYAPNWRDEELARLDPRYMDLRGLSCVLLAATLEGRENDTTHRQLSRRSETQALEEYKKHLENSVWDALATAKEEGRLPTLFEVRLVETKQSALVAVMTVLTELNVGAPRVKAIKGRKKEKLVGLVEVAWRGKVERTCFPIPFEIKYLTSATKHNFLEEVDLSTADKRMNGLIKECDLFISEMDLIYTKAEQSALYRRLHKHLPSFKYANYGLVVALNLNILLSVSSLEAPFTIILKDIQGDIGLSSLDRISVLVTTVLGALVTIGYGVIILTLAVTEIPLLIQELDEDAHELGEEVWSSENESVVAHWITPLFALCASIIFICLHLLNSIPSFEIYLVIIFIFNLPLVMKAFRNTIGLKPSTPFRRKYAIVYDTLLVKSFLRNHAILACFCFLGFFVNVEFFTLELLDVVAISPVIADIIRSVTSPGVALGLVFYLFVITVIIYAAFGMNHFGDALVVNKDNEDGTFEKRSCGSMLQCFYAIFHLGLSEAGNMNAFLATAYPGDTEYPMRIMYDSVFFVWVGIVLMNIITGLMVDTFSSIREEKQSRADTLDSVCFVCGTLRQTYEDMSLGHNAPSFDQHLQEEHDPWVYVHYIAYLKKKDPTEDSGIESYVRACVEENTLDWIPSRTSFFLESQGKSGLGAMRKNNPDDDIMEIERPSSRPGSSRQSSR